MRKTEKIYKHSQKERKKKKKKKMIYLVSFRKRGVAVFGTI